MGSTSKMLVHTKLTNQFLSIAKLQRLVGTYESRNISAVQQFNCIPTVSNKDILRYVNPYNEKYLKRIFFDFFSKYGQIYKMKIPGSRYHQVFIRDPEDAKHLLLNDGSMPILAG